MNLTASQKQAIEQQKQIARRIYGDCEFTIYTPKNTDIIRLVCEYTIKNMLGGTMQQSTAWTIGKRGKVEKTDGIKLFR